VLYGALFGLAYKGTATYLAKYFEAKGGDQSKYFTTTLLTFGIFGMSSYFILTSNCFSKQQCNYIHPYVVWIPILGFVAVRNLTELFRGNCSTLMLRAGKISLELFICQYHIFLAGNTKGSLILIPWGHPALNYVIVTSIFVWVSQEVHNMTSDLVYLMTPKDNKKIFINLVAMALVFCSLSLILR
ncbi:CAS1 domain-containing protein 1, partial [Armadillidium nasatum]